MIAACGRCLAIFAIILVAFATATNGDRITDCVVNGDHHCYGTHLKRTNEACQPVIPYHIVDVPHWSIACADWGTCELSPGYTNASDVASRWQCHCSTTRYDADGTHWKKSARPTCQYSAWQANGVHNWASKWSIVNGLLAILVAIISCIALRRATLHQASQTTNHRTRRCNLSTVALSCLAFSYTQLAVGNWMMASRDDGTYYESPPPAPVDRPRIDTINEEVARWFVADLTNIPTWIAYVLCYFFWRRLCTPVMTHQASSSFGTPQQMIVLAVGTTIYALICILGVVADQIADVYWGLYTVWKIFFSVFFFIAGTTPLSCYHCCVLLQSRDTLIGINARRTLIHVQNSRSISSPAALTLRTRATSNAVSPVAGNGGIRGITVAPAPVPANGYEVSVHSSSHVPVHANSAAVSPHGGIINSPSHANKGSSHGGIGSGSPAFTTTITANSIAQARAAAERHDVIVRMTTLTLGGSGTCLVQGLLFGTMAITSPTAGVKTAMILAATPLSCIWSLFMVGLFWR